MNIARREEPANPLWWIGRLQGEVDPCPFCGEGFSVADDGEKYHFCRRLPQTTKVEVLTIPGEGEGGGSLVLASRREDGIMAAERLRKLGVPASRIVVLAPH